MLMCCILHNSAYPFCKSVIVTDIIVYEFCMYAFFFFFFFLRLGLGQRRAVVIIGRWLLPSLVDTGDICCHYWQHILVYQYIKKHSHTQYLWNLAQSCK